jgi:hypothetical protein
VKRSVSTVNSPEGLTMKQIINTLSPAFSVSHKAISRIPAPFSDLRSLSSVQQALGRRTFATSVPHISASQDAQRATHAPSTVTAQPEANIGIAEEDLPTNLVYEDVEGGAGEEDMVDVTESVLRMLERDNGELSAEFISAVH